MNETRGSAIAAAIEVIGYERLVRVLYRHGLANLQRDAWYPQQTELDLLRDMYHQSEVTMIAVGMALADSVIFASSSMRTLRDALLRLNDAYQSIHRGYDVGSYALQMKSEREAILTCRTPYPADLEYGLLCRLAQKLRTPDTANFRLQRIDTTSGYEGDENDHATFHLTW